MKKLRKVLAMFCFIVLLGITAKPVSVQAASYITSAAKVNYSYSAQSDSFSFYADSAWKAEYQGYPGMVTITSSTSGGSGTNTVRFSLSENKQTIEPSGAIVIRNSSGTPLCVTEIKQAAKGKQAPAYPIKTSSNSSSQSGSSSSTTTTNSNSAQTKTLSYAYIGKEDSVSFYADRAWKAEFWGYPGMVTLKYATSGGSGNSCVYFKVNENKQTHDIEGAILIKDTSSGNVIYSISLKQEKAQPKQPEKPYFTFEKNIAKMDYEEQTGIVGVKSNTSWNVRTNCNWIHLKSTSGSGNAQISFTCDENKGDTARQGSILFEGSAFIYTFGVVQDPHRVNAPGIEIGVTEWGVYTKENMKTFKEPAINNVVRIDYDEACFIGSMLLVRMTHQTLIHTTESNAYCYVKNPSPNKYGECARPGCTSIKDHRFEVHFQHNEKLNPNNLIAWKQVPEARIKTTFYNEETGREEELTYIIRFTRVYLQTGPAKWYGAAENVVYPCGPDGNHPPADYYNDPWFTSEQKCPICSATFRGSAGSAKWDLDNHIARCHSVSMAEAYR